MREEGLSSIDVRQDAQDEFVRSVDRTLECSMFLAGGCTSFYLDERDASRWPGRGR